MKKIIIFALSIIMLNACSKTNEVTPDVKIENQKNVILSKNVNLTNLSTLLAQDADFNSFVSITNAQKNHVLNLTSTLNKEQLVTLKNDLENVIQNNKLSFPQLSGIDPIQFSQDFQTMTLNISNVHTKFSDLKGLSENDFIKVIDDAIKIIEPEDQTVEKGKCQTGFERCKHSNSQALARKLLSEQGFKEANIECLYSYVACHMSFQD